MFDWRRVVLRGFSSQLVFSILDDPSNIVLACVYPVLFSTRLLKLPYVGAITAAICFGAVAEHACYRHCVKCEQYRYLCVVCPIVVYVKSRYMRLNVLGNLVLEEQKGCSWN